MVKRITAVCLPVLLAPALALAAAADPAFDPAYSIRALMNTHIQPNADTVWQAVRYVVNEEGVQEDVEPQTDADWARLQSAAVALIAAGNALLLPGRVVDAEIPGPDYPAYLYLPEEIQALVASDTETWAYYIREMQFSTRATLETINDRDVPGLLETGAAINNACNGCHAGFWYRPN